VSQVKVRTKKENFCWHVFFEDHMIQHVACKMCDPKGEEVD
jgi:hypothetical protein